MKKILALMMAVSMAFAGLCACSSDVSENDAAGNTVDSIHTADTDGTGADHSESTKNDNSDSVQGITDVTLSDYFADSDKWEDDGGYYDLDSEKLFFDNYAAGDYAAVRLTEAYQNVTYHFSVTMEKLAPVSMDDGTWWDSEFLVIARSSQAGSSWQDDGSQVGYTLTSWGDMSTVFIGRCGYDDAFGEFPWNVNDGESHDIALTVANNADHTEVTLTLVVDGETVAEIVDDGSKVKNDRPSLYPDAGGLTIRCKWLEATIA